MGKEWSNQSGGFPKLSNPALRALAGAGIGRLKDLTKMSEKEFSKLHGIGPNAIKAIKQAFSEKGLSFKQ